MLFAALVFVIFVVAAFAAGRSCAGNGTEPAQSSSDFSEICLRLEQHAETLLMPAVFCALRDGFFGELRYKRRFDRKDLPKFSKGGFEYYHTLTFHATEVMENPKEI